MKSSRYSLCMLLMISLSCPFLSAQQPTSSAASSTVVPRLVNFSGKAVDEQGKPISGITGATFAIYKEEQGGAPLWIETQNIQADAYGNYNVQLGASQSRGLPGELFISGEARWLGVQLNHQAEQPRVLLLSEPYALKAADAETVGGLPPAAFVLAVPPSSNGGSTSSGDTSSAGSAAPPGSSNVTTTGGTVNGLPLWTTKTNIQSSAISQKGTGTTAKIGIGTTTPAATLDVKGTGMFRGALTLPATGTATATAGKDSQPQDLVASSFNSSTSTAVNQTFQWQAEPATNNTSHPSGTLNLLYGVGASKPGETGLKLSNMGLFTFAPGQTFPGTGDGTVTSVGLSAPSSDFKVNGSPVTTSGTLGLSWTVAPTSAATANAIVKRDANGSFSVGPISASTASCTIPAVAGTDTSNGGQGGGGVVGTSNYIGVTGTGGDVGVYGVGGIEGVFATSTGTNGYGVLGQGNTGVIGTGDTYGVFGDGGTYGVYGFSSVGSGVAGVSSSGAGVYAQSDTGWAVDAYGTSNATGVLAGSVTGWAAWFSGDVEVDGNLFKAGGAFKIDHPLDPASKYLYHSFVESPDMKNIYDGRATTDAQGDAVIDLPEWFETLNRDFRYQLTVIGQFAQAIVSSAKSPMAGSVSRPTNPT